MSEGREQAEEEELLTTAELAARLKWSVNHTYLMSKRGAFPRIVIGGSIRYKLSEVLGELKEKHTERALR